MSSTNPFRVRPFERRRVLHVENHADTAELTRIVLGERGFSCRSATTCEEAYSQIANNLFDAYLLSQRMPDGSGVDVIRAIRMSDRNTPILFVSGDGLDNTRKQALDVGADFCFVKPLDPYFVAQIAGNRIFESRLRAIHARVDERRAILDAMAEQA